MTSPSRARPAARRIALALAALVTFASFDALADKVATLHARGSAPLGERTSIRAATDGGARGLGHETVAENEVLQGEGAAGDKIGTSEGLVAVGKTTGADWVVEPHVQSSDAGTRVELKVCQVSSGRVETLARDLDPKGDPLVQMREMLALLLRPQGVGDDPLPWDAKKTTPPPPPEVLPKDKPKPKEPAPPPLVWGEHGKISVGASAGYGSIAARPDNAVGRRTFFTWSVAANFAIPNKRWIELAFRLHGAHGAGSAMMADVGARLIAPPSGRFAFGIGGALGVFGAFGSGIVRPAFGLDPFVSLAIVRNVQAELAWVNRLSPGEGGAILHTSAHASLLARF
ncbi:MAG: hypothetical protein HYV09_07745 [Deltaproteobacteria bacterium]|nr:hypothetical protein [Deltaproteobacteria bacterium]